MLFRLSLWFVLALLTCATSRQKLIRNSAFIRGGVGSGGSAWPVKTALPIPFLAHGFTFCGGCAGEGSCTGA